MTRQQESAQEPEQAESTSTTRPRARLVVGMGLGVLLVLGGQLAYGAALEHVQYRPDFMLRDAYLDGREAAQQAEGEEVDCDLLAAVAFGRMPDESNTPQDQFAYSHGCFDVVHGRPSRPDLPLGGD